MGRLAGRIALGALGRLPLHLASRAAGRLAALRLPGPLQRAEIRLFGAAAGVDFGEAAPLESYASLQAFFTRALLRGARPIDPAPDALVSPCDGSWGASGRVERGTLLQVKGRPYSLGALLARETAAPAFEGGVYATFYLAPRDYHRFHAPCDLRFVRARYVPGTLWPVNPLGVEGIDGLFAQNERICAHAETRHGGALALVAVGATLVGKVRVAFDDLATNLAGSGRVERYYADGGHPFAKGDEWGRFEFGSTIVLVAAAGVARLDARPPGSPLRLGARIGTLLGAPAGP
jgi:phosphatidylserine decarboxylase